MNTDAIIEALRAEVPPEIERHVPTFIAREASTGRCVQATRVGIEALRYFGVHARPLVTLMLVGNHAWSEWMLDGSPEPMPDEVWAVGIDPTFKPGERRYPAHLVIEIEGHILDLDAGLYARPERGIHVPPTILTPLRQQHEDGPLAAADLEEGGVIVYGPCHPPVPQFRGTGAWKDTKKWTGPVIRRMRDRLKEAA